MSSDPSASSISKQLPRTIYDIDNVFGNDLVLSSTGDLQTVSGSDRGEQRILRRLLTNPGTYIWHVTYGAGVPQFVGDALSSELFVKIKALINSQIFLEEAVSKNPPPQILLQTIQGGLYCNISYIDKPTQNPIVVTFNVSP